MIMSKSHNKKRNVGLVYEFLVRYISRALVENREGDAQKAIRILNRRFKAGTQIYREFRLFNSLLTTRVSSGNVVSSIISEARSATRRLNLKELSSEKSKLIREINYSLQDPTFFNQQVDDYKAYATIQILLNEWRGSDIDIAQMAELEDNLSVWIMSERADTVELEDQKNLDINDTIVSIMTEKISQKYQGVLNERQQELIKRYIVAIEGDSSATLDLMEQIRKDTKTAISEYISLNSDSAINDKLSRATAMLESNSVHEINDTNVGHHLSFIKLIEEIRS